MRRLVTSYLDEFLARDDAVAFALRRGLRTVRWSYKQIAKSAFAFAELLTERGVQKADRLLLCGANSPEWVVTFFGCLLRGAIVVPLDVQSDVGFVERVQRQVNAKLAIFDTSACQTFRLTLPVIPFEAVSSLLSPTRDSPSAGLQSVNDIAEIVFTSGTTAEPKGVVLTHQNLLANMQPLEMEIRDVEEMLAMRVWLFFRFALSFRDVEEMLAMRGVSLTYEIVREWCLEFGQATLMGCVAGLHDPATYGISLTELKAPFSDRLIAEVDAAHGQHLFDIAEAQRKTEV